MSKHAPPPLQNADEEESNFFSLFALLKQDFHPLLDDFSAKVVRYVRDNHEDFRTETPDMSNMMSMGFITLIHSFLSIWDHDPPQDEEGSSTEHDQKREDEED